MQPHADALVAKAVALALDGDVSALRLCIDRLMPPLRPQREPVRIATNGSLDEKAGQIFEAAVSGTISADIAAELVGLLTAQARILETADLLQRLEDLEIKIIELQRSFKE